MTTKKSAEKKLVSIKKSPKSLGKPMKGRDILVKALVNEGVTVILAIRAELLWKSIKG
jgi:CxxC motif-containing protein